MTCRLSPTPTATATDPLPANSPTMHSRVVCRQFCLGEPACLPKISHTNFFNHILQSPVHAVPGPGQWHRYTNAQTDIATYKLNQSRGQLSVLGPKIYRTRTCLVFVCKCAWLVPGTELTAGPGLGHRHRQQGHHDQDGVRRKHGVCQVVCDLARSHPKADQQGPLIWRGYKI